MLRNPPERKARNRQTLGNMLKEPTHIQAHLVFADTQSSNKKPEEFELSQCSEYKK
ncbi:MAG: hypothetical protein PHI32_14705 [Dysgonamonadaceae bacterium]|nr:hypothetical protein [Dysgonamonadaceae bacterium]